MSAGFKVGGQVWWCSNGMLELLLETLEQQALAGGQDPGLVAWLEECRQYLFTGIVVELDEILDGTVQRQRLLELLDATTIILRPNLTDYGQDRIEQSYPALRAMILGTDQRTTEPGPEEDA